MEWFIAVVAVAALGVAAVAAAGGMGQMSKDAVQDTYRQLLPDRPLTGADLHQARFGIALRGYSMAQVDDLLDRVATEIEARDARIAELLGLSATPAGATGSPTEFSAGGPSDRSPGGPSFDGPNSSDSSPGESNPGESNPGESNPDESAPTLPTRPAGQP